MPTATVQHLRRMRSRRRRMPLDGRPLLWKDNLIPITTHIPSTVCHPSTLQLPTCPVPKSIRSSMSVFIPRWALVQHLSVSCPPLCNTLAPFAPPKCSLCDSSSLWYARQCGGMTQHLKVNPFHFFECRIHKCLNRSYPQSFQQGEERSP
jgi:hypothetical protein